MFSIHRTTEGIILTIRVYGSYTIDVRVSVEQLADLKEVVDKYIN
jgi:hypothetical protein